MNIKLVKPRDYWLSPYTVIEFLSFGKFKSDSIFPTSSRIFLLAFLETSSQICSISEATYQSVNSANLSKLISL